MILKAIDDIVIAVIQCAEDGLFGK